MIGGHRLSTPATGDRYSRQARFWGIGAEGQARLATGRVLVVGCGALGSAAIDLLARSGVGHLVVVDRDFVELSNLQRQLLYDEADAAAGTPKAVAAAAAVGRINAGVEVEAVVADVTARQRGGAGRPRRRRRRRHGQPRDALPAQRRLREGGHPLGLRRRGRLDRDVDDDPARRDGVLPVPVSRRPSR